MTSTINLKTKTPLRNTLKILKTQKDKKKA
jgi:hypothetical protein